jgi:E3 ubiquitin-protein ligase SHPRH
LKVVVYEGWRSVHNQFYASAGIGGKRKRGAQDVDANPEKSTMDRWVQKVTQADIVLTTYQNLAADWNVAAPPVKRARRSTAAYVEYARPRSALLLCDWRRVAIDEIQTLDIGSASNAANMVKSIKRQYSLAISGTPAKVSIEDLASSMSFLGAIFNNIAIRHVKASLSPEDMTMKIPRQTRYLVPIKLDRVERAVSCCISSHHVGIIDI